MTIAEYLKKRRKTHQWFADLIEVERTAVGNWINGIRYPRRELAKRIVEKTKGQVKIKDIYA
jgi:hypothetical protein